jgi:hypothetical protein
MKTVGRILIILTVFALVMGITYVIVNARSSSNSGIPPRFGQENRRLASPDGAPPKFPNGERPEFPGGGREFSGERGGSEWLFGSLKNLAIIGMIVALIVLPKSWIQKRKRAAQIAAG